MTRKIILIIGGFVFGLLTCLYLPLANFSPKLAQFIPEIKTAKAWYGNDYSYRRAVVLDGDKIATTTASFPILATTTLADLRTIGNDGKVQNANGYDIVWVDSDDTTLLDFEVEKYVPATGEIVHWVETSIVSSTNKTVYMYYGNSGISANQATTTGVWDSNYKGVWHMNQDPSSASTTDSTINSNDGTTGGSMTSGDLVNGEIGKAIDFDGADDLINCGKNSSLNNLSAFTAEAWIYPRSRGEGVNDSPAGRIFDKTKKYFFMEDVNGTGQHIGQTVQGESFTYRLSPNSSINYNAWSHAVVTWSGGAYTNINFRINGVLQNGSGSGTGLNPYDDSVYDLIIGNVADGIRTFDGIIDEVRISNTARTAGWIATEYNNQVSVGEFLTIGGEECLAVPVERSGGENVKSMIKGGSVFRGGVRF